MSRNVIAFAVYSALSVIAAFGGVLQKWTCETSEISEREIVAYHGETVELQCQMMSYGRVVSGCGQASFLWQTNGMGTAWWTTNATCSSGYVKAEWTPYMDGGASACRFFFQVTDAKGSNYRANGTISLLGSPYGDCREMPLPVKEIDFAKVKVVNATNAPWATETVTNGVSDRLTAVASELRSQLDDKQDKLKDYTTTNAVRGIVDLSFVNGTQKVNSVVGSFDNVSNRVYEIETEMSGLTNRIESLETATNDLAALVSGLTSQTNVWNSKQDTIEDYTTTNAVESLAGGLDSALEAKIEEKQRSVAWLSPAALGRIREVPGVTGGVRSIAHHGNEFLACRVDMNVGCTIFRSTNPTNSWTQTATLAGTYFRAMKYADGKWIAAGKDDAIYSSSDGSTWTKMQNAEMVSCTDVTYDYRHGTWCVSAYGGLYGSPDGETWTRTKTGAWRSVQAGNGVIVAGSADGGSGGLGGLWHSTDGGITWSKGTGVRATSVEFRSIWYANGVFEAGAYGIDGMYRSEDGKVWELVYGTAANYYAISYNDGLWVAVASQLSDAVHCSYDSKNWGPMPVGHVGYGMLSCIYRDGSVIAGSANCANEGGLKGILTFTTTPTNFVSNYIYSKPEVDRRMLDVKKIVSQKADKSDVPFRINTAGTIVDRCVNVVTVGTFSIPRRFTDLMIRYAGTPVSMSFQDTATARYGDVLPTAQGNYLIRVTRIGASDALVKVETLIRR